MVNVISHPDEIFLIKNASFFQYVSEEMKKKTHFPKKVLSWFFRLGICNLQISNNIWF